MRIVNFETLLQPNILVTEIIISTGPYCSSYHVDIRKHSIALRPKRIGLIVVFGSLWGGPNDRLCLGLKKQPFVITRKDSIQKGLHSEPGEQHLTKGFSVFLLPFIQLNNTPKSTSLNFVSGQPLYSFLRLKPPLKNISNHLKHWTVHRAFVLTIDNRKSIMLQIVVWRHDIINSENNAFLYETTQETNWIPFTEERKKN